jgi:hypothetical protein
LSHRFTSDARKAKKMNRKVALTISMGKPMV